MVQTSVPRRHTGAVRTVSSNDGWKPTLTEFKLTPEQLERYKAGEKIDDILKGEKAMKVNAANNANKADSNSFKVVTSKSTKNDLQSENKETSKELELLKRELVDAHKLVTEKEELLKDSVQEKDELIRKLQNQLDKSVELYETAMLDKEQLHKENTNLVNRVQTYEREIDNLQKRCDRYQSEYIELEDEVNGLRRFALTKLKKDVYPA
ncbi:hypothetical protein [Heyndrickxia oleronia]|uniref:hypothetical protein n=1 Tax=Heyndrickxia oleronia TaxID=38875 RepID=UPI003F253E5F